MRGTMVKTAKEENIKSCGCCVPHESVLQSSFEGAWHDKSKINIMRQEQPLFWQESKQTSFCQAILDNIQANAVIDLTPAKGVLAKACLTCGVPYNGLRVNAGTKLVSVARQALHAKNGLPFWFPRKESVGQGPDSVRLIFICSSQGLVKTLKCPNVQTLRSAV